MNKVRAAAEFGYTWVDDVAIIERHHSGRIATHTPHGSATTGVGWGALLGALVGVFFSTAGFIALTGLCAGTGALIEKASKEAYVPEDLRRGEGQTGEGDICVARPGRDHGHG